jgi:plasmid stabilization system protein ParE
VRRIRWTARALQNVESIREFIAPESPNAARLVVARLVAATERLATLPESGRIVPEYDDPSLRELIQRPYRIVYRLVGADELHIITVYHSARLLSFND